MPPLDTTLPVALPQSPEHHLSEAILKLLSAHQPPTHVSMNVLFSLYRFLALNNLSHLADAANAAGLLHEELQNLAVQAGLAGATTYSATTH